MIIDCFMFNGELDLLSMRLKYLNDIIDYFVIVESDLTFSGNPCELVYPKNIQRFKNYQHKILYFPFTPNTIGLNFVKDRLAPWNIEEQVRNHLYTGIKLFNTEDYIIINDLDEIPHKSSIYFSLNKLDNNIKYISFDQELLYYGIDTRIKDDWRGSVITKVKYIDGVNTPQQIRTDRGWFNFVYNGGWHLSYWMTPEQIRSKIQNFSHQEYNTEPFINLDHIKYCIDNNKDILNRDYLKFEKTSRRAFPEDFYQIFSEYTSNKTPHFYKDIEGWFEDCDIAFYRSILECFDGPAHFVEIGSYAGKSSSFMAVEIINHKKDIRFDCIDLWEDESLYNKFIKNIIPVQDRINYNRMSSTDAAKLYANNSLDFIFIDANHEYDYIKDDILHWFPKIKENGIISGHDYNFPDVRRAVNETFPEVKTIGSCWYFSKDKTKLASLNAS